MQTFVIALIIIALIFFGAEGAAKGKKDKKEKGSDKEGKGEKEKGK